MMQPPPPPTKWPSPTWLHLVGHFAILAALVLSTADAPSSYAYAANATAAFTGQWSYPDSWNGALPPYASTAALDGADADRRRQGALSEAFGALSEREPTSFAFALASPDKETDTESERQRHRRQMIEQSVATS